MTYSCGSVAAVVVQSLMLLLAVFSHVGFHTFVVGAVAGVFLAEGNTPAFQARQIQSRATEATTSMISSTLTMIGSTSHHHLHLMSQLRPTSADRSSSRIQIQKERHKQNQPLLRQPSFLQAVVVRGDDEVAVTNAPIEEEEREAPVLQQHEFWGTERTAEEVVDHVGASLEHAMTRHNILYGNVGGDVSNSINKAEKTASTTKTLERLPRVEVLSTEPPLVIIHDFLSQSMCAEVIQTARGSHRMERSTTGSEQTSSTTRTSSTVWLRDGQCRGPLRYIADAVSAVSGLPPSFMENLQVVKYEPGQEFKLHTDHQDSFNDLPRKGRLATCLVYLSEPKSGGQTWFPGVMEDNDGIDGDGKTNALLDNVEEGEVKVAPLTGSAVFFWNTLERPGCDGYNPDMFLNADIKMRHAGLPVLEGEKWICNRWVHPVEFSAGVRGN